MEISLIIKSILDTIKEKDSDIDSKYISINISNSPSHVFLFKFSKSLSLDNLWMSISREIAVYFQSKIKSDFEKWNIYIIYLCAENVDKGLKNRIENDKFSCRKIVEDQFSEVLTQEAIDKLVVNNITHKNIDLLIDETKGVESHKQYTSLDESLWKAIPKSSISGDKNVQLKLLNAVQQIVLGDEN